jgi:hypothetical protein
MKTEKQNKTKNPKYPRTMGQLQKDNYICIRRIPGEQKKVKEIFETIMTENFHHINVRHQTTD